MSLIVIGAAPPRIDLAGAVVLADAADARFDAASETWAVTDVDGRPFSAPVVIDTRPSDNPAVATHGVPNWFRIPGPDAARQSRYVARCLRLLQRTGAARIEAKGRVVLHRWQLARVTDRFYLSGAEPGPDDLYDGPATLTVAGERLDRRVRLIGHLDAIDGHYHWQGTLFGAVPPAARGAGAAITLTVAERCAPVRVVEQTPWGDHMVAGVGEPPFPR